MDWNRSENALHEELLKETCRDQRRSVAWQDVSGYDGSAENATDDHDETTAEIGRQVPEECTSNDGAYLPDCCDDSRLSRTRASLSLQECRIEVLAAVADTVESRQEDDHVRQYHPVHLDGAPCFSAENSHTCCARQLLVIVQVLNMGRFGFAFGLHHEESVRLWEAQAENYDEDGRPSAKPGLS